MQAPEAVLSQQQSNLPCAYFLTPYSSFPSAAAVFDQPMTWQLTLIALCLVSPALGQFMIVCNPQKVSAAVIAQRQESWPQWQLCSNVQSCMGLSSVLMTRHGACNDQI